MMNLSPIDRTDRDTEELTAALEIYRDTILPEAQNPERQILYWIEHSKEDLADEFRCFAIRDGRSVVGYLQYTFFREEHIFFFEYLCVRAGRSRGLLPSRALDCIEDHLAANYRPGFTIVFEIALQKGSGDAWVSDARLLRYFSRLGFRTIDFAYRYPVLQSYDGGTSYPADLMVRLPGDRTEVTSSEMRTILRCLYFRHYLRWDRPFLAPGPFAERERLIDKLYSHEVASLGDDDRRLGTKGDDSRSAIIKFEARNPRIGPMLVRVFGRKLPRLMIVIATVLAVHRILGSFWLLIPFVPIVAALYCLVDNTEGSRKLLKLLINKFSLEPRQS